MKPQRGLFFLFVIFLNLGLLDFPAAAGRLDVPVVSPLVCISPLFPAQARNKAGMVLLWRERNQRTFIFFPEWKPERAWVSSFWNIKSSSPWRLAELGRPSLLRMSSRRASAAPKLTGSKVGHTSIQKEGCHLVLKVRTLRSRYLAILALGRWWYGGRGVTGHMNWRFWESP